MEEQTEENLLGFDKGSIESSLQYILHHRDHIKQFLNIYACKLGMDLSAGFSEDMYQLSSSYCSGIRGMLLDNDSGYISQNVESNSSETSDSRQVSVDNSLLKAEAVYMNEDTLFEKPQVPTFPKETEEECEEFGHLFYMNGSVLDSSVTSRSTDFSGFNGDESEISDLSGTIPVASPILVLSNKFNIDSNSQECTVSASKNVNTSKIRDVFIPSAVNNSEDISNNLNESNSTNAESNVNIINPLSSDEGESFTYGKDNTNFNCTQTRLVDTNTCGTSLFEDFYSHLTNLYTRSDFPSEDVTKIAINPNNLHFISQKEDSFQENSVMESPKNSYYQLKTVSKNNTIKTDAELATNQLTETKSDINSECTKGGKLQTKTVKKVETPLKPYKNQVNPNVSPELFSDEEEPTESFSQSFSQIQKKCEQIYTTKNDRKLLRQAQESLCGVPPPPSITIIQMSVNEILQKIKDNNHLFASLDATLSESTNIDNKTFTNVQKNSVNNPDISNMSQELCNRTTRQSLLVTCKKEEIPKYWPDVLQYRYHGLHYNRSKVSEDFEHLCLKYAERYIGAETQSSCTVFRVDVVSPSKRKFKQRRMAKSPGKRLSHLARRRITFSKDSFQSSSVNSSFIGSRTMQIMVDARKFDLLQRRKSPKKKSPRKTPGKSPRRKTPSSSAKKRFAMRLKMYNNEESMDSVASTSSSRASATKRALFQSPDKGETTNGLLQIFGSNTSSSSSHSSRRKTPRRALFTSPIKMSPGKMTISSLYPPKRKPTPKRALFMSPNKSPKRDACDKKRKRADTGDDHPTKLPRSVSLTGTDALSESKSKTVYRTQSSSSGSQTQDLVEHRKKKLIWAVAEALRSQNIDMKHPQFKVYASVLARVIRHFLPNLFNNGPRPEGSSTESMLRIARQHVFAVTREKTVNQIIREAENNKAKSNKPSSCYVGIDKVDKLTNKENILQDRLNIINSDLADNKKVKPVRGQNVERIRRVINFGDDGGSTSR